MEAAFCINANAEAIEHRGDRYVIHIDKLELNGDESLMDIKLTGFISIFDFE